MTLEPLPAPTGPRLEDVYGASIELDDADAGTDDAAMDDLLKDWPGGVLIGIAPESVPPEYSPAEFWEFMTNIMALVVPLREDGWQQPDPGHAAGGRTSGASRRSVRTARRDLVREILLGLPEAYRRNPTNRRTIGRVHEQLWLRGAGADADASPVLRSCRTVTIRTVAEDLRKISLPSKYFDGS
jgi:hypothetical protein